MDKVFTDRTNMIDDLTGVGKTKIVGYLPRETITEILGFKTADLMTYAKQNNLLAMELEEDECNTFSGAIFFADMESLEKMVNLPEFDKIFDKKEKRKFSFERNAKAFLSLIIFETVPEQVDKEIYDMIALAFNNQSPEYKDRNMFNEVNQGLTEKELVKSKKNKM